MAITVALLQGVNVGKYKRIRMDDFKQIVADLGGTGMTTVANSGNIVFRHDDSLDTEQLQAAIEKAVSDHVGQPVPTITRTKEEMQGIISANPYSQVTDPKCLHVEFLNEKLPDALEGIDFAEDHLTMSGREIYMHLPNKMSGSTYDSKALFKRLGTQHTSRNWNTVTKLVSIAEKISE